MLVTRLPFFPGPTGGPGDLIISDAQSPACVGFRIPVALPHYSFPPPTPRFSLVNSCSRSLLCSKARGTCSLDPPPHFPPLIRLQTKRSPPPSMGARGRGTSFATIQPARKAPRSHSINNWRGTIQNIDSSVRTIWCSNSAGATLPFWATGV